MLFVVFLTLRAIIPAALLIRYQMSKVMGDKNVLTKEQVAEVNKNGMQM